MKALWLLQAIISDRQSTEKACREDRQERKSEQRMDRRKGKWLMLECNNDRQFTASDYFSHAVSTCMHTNKMRRISLQTVLHDNTIIVRALIYAWLRHHDSIPTSACLQYLRHLAWKGCSWSMVPTVPLSPTTCVLEMASWWPIAIGEPAWVLTPHRFALTCRERYVGCCARSIHCCINMELSSTNWNRTCSGSTRGLNLDISHFFLKGKNATLNKWLHLLVL